MFTELIDLPDYEPQEQQGFQGCREVYINESLKRVYISPGGSILPNKFALWPEDYNLDKGE